MSNTNLSHRKSDESPDENADDHRPRLDAILEDLDPDAAGGGGGDGDDEDGDDDPRPDGGTVAADGPDHGDPAAGDRPSRGELWDAVRALAETVECQRERIDRLEATVEAQDERIDEQAARIDEQRARIEDQRETIEDQRETVADLREWADRKEETIRSVVADLNAREETAAADGSGSGDTPAGHAGPEPASSPLDFFLNCQQFHVDRALSANRARAVEIVRRHEEFGRRKRSMSTYAGTAEGDGSVVFTKDEVEDGLLAIQGRRPHRQTVQRVWEYLQELAGDDADRHQFRDRRNDTRREGIRFAAETIARFEEERYVGLNLLDDASRIDPESPGDVTPVVIGNRDRGP